MEIDEDEPDVLEIEVKESIWHRIIPISNRKAPGCDGILI